MTVLEYLKSKFDHILVYDWRDAWKWLSVQFAALIAVWPLVPEDTQATIVSAIASVIGIEVSVPTVLAIMVIVGREVYGRWKRAAPMTRYDWIESAQDIGAGMAGCGVVLAAAYVGI